VVARRPSLPVARRKDVARELITLLPNLVRLFRGLLGDERVPRRSKALLLLGAVWLASPIDLMPEFLPGIGAIDDAVVARLVLQHVVKRAGPQVVKEHWRGVPWTIGVLLRAARRFLDGRIAQAYRRNMSAILFGLFCAWLGYRWGEASSFARGYEQRFERENEDFLNRLRTGSES
jgi:uncharacterized membrane protein YkvA (DUF1232 family)